MRVAVLGSGVIGVTTAYYLRQAGHEVVVLDRQPGPARETSYANAGEISPGYASPWAAPGVPLKALKWLLTPHSPLIFGKTPDRQLLAWLFGMLRSCTSTRYAVNKARMVRLAEYSRDCLRELSSETGLGYDGRSMGTLQLFRTQAQLDHAHKDIRVLRASGVPFEVLDRAGCIAAEPGLAFAEEAFVGGLRLPNDDTGDCYMFTAALAERCAASGVEFRFSTPIDEIESDGRRVMGVRTPAGLVVADAYVVALGSYSTPLLQRVGIEIPVQPVKGYSLTAAILDPAKAPVSTVLDETYKVAITRLGHRVRIGGLAELSGFDLSLPDSRRATLERSAGSLFGDSCDLANASFWCGLRPMTPDGPPLIGATGLQGLYLNTGHGTLGWTMACGSGRVLADLLSGRRPEIDTSGLSLDRYDTAA
jgi:D-amino-acid dehydrogenase